MICKKCNIDRPLDRFRVKVKNGYTYTEGTCINCWNEYQKLRFRQIKDVPEYKEKNRLRVRAYYHKNKELIAQKMKLKRQTPEHKKARKAYIEKNKEKIYQQEKICKKKYSDRIRDNLEDIYVVYKVIGKNRGIKPQDIPQELIELKRLQILAKRTLLKIKNTPK